MRRRLTRVLLAALAVSALWWAAASNRDWFYFHPGKDNVVRDAEEFAASLQGTGLDVHELGQVSYGDSRLPLWVLRQPDANPRAPTVCLLAGVHGNEPAGVQALLAFARRLHARPEKYAALRYVIVPLANPWGWERNLRHNGDNRDVARQFARGEAQEAKLLSQLFAGERCELFIDLHEDRFREGFYLLAYAAPAAAALTQVIRSVEAETGVRVARRGEGGLIPVTEPELTAVRLTTASLWARLNGARLALIVETFDGLPLEQRVAVHLAVIERLARLLPAR